ncbi:hypothetical protein [Stutzerimonas urumqiensis]|nr:hypothetical protein [Stutzerimonas urumqiensis]
MTRLDILEHGLRLRIRRTGGGFADVRHISPVPIGAPGSAAQAGRAC